MKILCLMGLAGLLVCTPAAAQITLGGDDRIEVPLERIPSVGEFVQAYVNGHGPFSFRIDLSGPTRLTPAVAKAAELKIKPDDSVMLVSVGSIEEEEKAEDVDIRVAGINYKATPLMIPDQSLSAYAPVKNYGGVIGAEILQHGALTVDTAHDQLFLSSNRESRAEPGEYELPISMTERYDFILVPEIELSFNGKVSDLLFSSSEGGLYLYSSFKSGEGVFAKSPYRYKVLSWFPDHITEGEEGFAPDAAVAGVHLGARRTYRDVSPFRESPETGFNKRKNFINQREHHRRIVLAGDGTVGLAGLGSSFVRVDSAAQRIWLKTPESGEQAPPEPAPTVGFTPWPYRDRVVVRRLVLGSPADLAGLRPGDEILSLNDGDIYQYYRNFDPRGRDREVKVVFRGRSGERTVVLTPALPKD